MKRTIASSLLFLYPLNCAFHAVDVWMLNLCAIAMAVSLVNHSHTFHPDTYRRKIFGTIDENVMIGLVIYITGKCLYLSTHFWECLCTLGGLCVFISVTYFGLLRGWQKEGRVMEAYKEWQKNVHVLFHVVSIIGLTMCYRRFVWAN